MAHQKVKPDASSREEGGKDYHSSYRCLLLQRLSLNTEDCFKLGTRHLIEPVSPLSCKIHGEKIQHPFHEYIVSYSRTL